MNVTSTWQVQAAKQRFSELVERAIKDGPQVVTRHGREVVVVLDIEEYRKLDGDDGDRFKRWMIEGPRLDNDEVDDLFGRQAELPRNVDL